MPNKTTPDTNALSLTRTSGFGSFYDVAGHRSLLMGAEGGNFEVWLYPFKAFQDCRIGLVEGGSIKWMEPFLKSYEITPHASIFTYETPGQRLKQTIFAPVNEPAVVMLFELTSCCDTPIAVQLRPDLQMMWPLDAVALNATVHREPDTGRWVVASDEKLVAAVAGWSEADPAQAGVDADIPDGAVLSVGETKDGRACFVVTGDKRGVKEASALWDEIIAKPEDYLEQTERYYAALDAESTGFESPDADLNLAYRWAKIGLDKCYKISPGTGAGFVAGYNVSGAHGRPGFGWYFGRDSSWTQFAFNCMGQFAKSKENLELLGRWQIKDGPNCGKIYHEISAAHDWMPQEHTWYAFPAGDATPFYIVDMADYLHWTGDVEFIKQQWPSIMDAIDWCYRMDVDGDLLIDNPPAGHQWYDNGEKNLIDLVGIWCRALEGAAELGRAIGAEKAEKWSRDAEKVRKIINTDFWNESDGYIYDRKLPDGSMSDITTANPTVPLLWKQVDPDKAQRAIDRISKPDMTVGWGLRTNSNLDSIYSPEGYHEGTVWPLTTGWGSLACYAYGRGEEGMRYLKANADLTWDFCLGYITEVLDGDNRVATSCPHQCWSEAMVVQPIVAGLMGIEVDALAKRIIVAPQVPQDWDRAKITNLRVAGDLFDVTYLRKNGKATLTIEQKQGDSGYVMQVPGAPDVAISGSVTVDLG